MLTNEETQKIEIKDNNQYESLLDNRNTRDPLLLIHTFLKINTKMEGRGIPYDEMRIPFDKYFGEPNIELSRMLYLNRRNPDIIGFYQHRISIYASLKDIYALGTPNTGQ